ncbi:hypothetical protein JXQ70_18515 [bacterium]|nr:hypothetical protein [bacterium]
MFKQGYIVFVFLLLVVISGSCNWDDEYSPEEVYAYHYGSDYYDEMRGLLSTSDGGCVMVGLSSSSLEYNYADTKGYALKVDQDGQVQWEVSDSVQFDNISFDGVVAVDDGYLLLRNCYYNSALVKLDPDGALIWQVNLQCEQGYNQHFSSLIRSADGQLYIAGCVDKIGVAHDYHALLIKVDYLGNEIWRVTGDDIAQSNARAVSAIADGGCYLAGYRERADTSRSDPIVWRIGADGQQLWTNLHDGAETDDELSDIITLENGGCLALGHTAQVGESSHPLLMRYDEAGNTLWSRKFGSARARLNDLTELENGSILAVGSYQSDYYLASIDSEGNKNWDKAFGWFESEGILKITPSETDLFLIGGTIGYNAIDFVVFRANCQGEIEPF